MRLAGPFSGENLVKLWQSYATGWLLLAAVSTLSSALAVIYSKHRMRSLHIALQSLHSERANLNVEWSRLLLERSTWLADLRVEQLAKELLHMHLPEAVEIIGP